MIYIKAKTFIFSYLLCILERKFDMTKIALMIYVIVAPTLAGMAMVVVLTIGADTSNPIMLSVLAGAVVAIPASWMIAKQLNSIEGLIKKT